MAEIDYIVETSKPFDQAVEAVQRETENAGFRVLYIHDVQQTLQNKGFVIEPLKIIEICNAKNAYEVLQKDIRLALMLPCKINVYVRNGKTYISGLKPTIISDIFPKQDISHLAEEVEEVIKTIINKAA